MNAAGLLNSRAVVIAAGVAVGALALYFIGRQVAGAVGSSVKNFNRGTPYEGAGVVGAAGNVANQVSGGVLERIGGWLGGAFYDLTHAEYDPNK